MYEITSVLGIQDSKGKPAYLLHSDDYRCEKALDEERANSE